jgi:hypothetical protein
MKKLKLNTWERVTLTRLAESAPPNTIDILRKGLKFLEVMELSEKDKEQVGFEIKDSSATWKDPGYEFDIELSNESLVFFEKVIKPALAEQRWPMQAASMAIALYEKLEAE